MHWTTSPAGPAVVLADLDAAQVHLQTALTAVDEARTAAAGLLATTAWASPAMAAFQQAQDRWLTELGQTAHTLRAVGQAVADARWSVAAVRR